MRFKKELISTKLSYMRPLYGNWYEFIRLNTATNTLKYVYNLSQLITVNEHIVDHMNG